MKVEKNSPLAQMLLKLAAERDPKLREAIRNGEVEGVNIIAVGGAPRWRNQRTAGIPRQRRG